MKIEPDRNEEQAVDELSIVRTYAPWPFWPTLGLTLLIGIASLLLQIAFIVIWMVVSSLTHSGVDIEQLGRDSLFLLVCTLVSYPVVLGLMVIFVRIRRGVPLVDYLALHRPSWRSVWPWLGWLFLYLLLSSLATHWLDVPPPQTMLDLTNPQTYVLLVLVVGIGAPVVEELIFRGFMFKGIAASRAGNTGAVILTSLSWVLVHAMQYGWFECLNLFVLGILLGCARVKSGSVVVPVIIHVLNNMIAMASLIILIESGML